MKPDVLTPAARSNVLIIKSLVCVGALGGILLLTGCAAAPGARSADLTAAQPDPVLLEATYGIRVEGLRLSSAGSMLDFRYRVLNAEKAAPLLNGKLQPYLWDETRGAKLGVPDAPVLGRIRQTSRNNNIRLNRTYFIMFGNPGKALQSGDRVTLLLEQEKVTTLTVQ